MIVPEYKSFDGVNPKDFISLLNTEKVRAHLIQHQCFDSDSVVLWIKDKLAVDVQDHCRVRAICANDDLVGWCGIQYDHGRYEIAIILDEHYWGMGKVVFKDVMSWARELGHDEIFIHCLHTRPDYRFLRKMAKNVFETEMLGDKFVTYQLPVN